MDKDKTLFYIEKSFLSPLLENEDITDISYNGESIYYVSNSEGRKRSDIIIDSQQSKDFIRQIANLCECQFSFTSPTLNVSIGKYRINAIHQSIGKANDEDVITFSIRIASNVIKIKDDSNFFTLQIVELLKIILKSQCSIVIGGVTSTGKTEFQKYLLQKVPINTRVIVIDNVLELDRVRKADIDLSCWQCDEKNLNSSSSKLIKEALRNNPDWLILAEARGEEMVDVLNSAMTGMPIITTIHSLDSYSMPHRMARMMMRSSQKIDFDEALADIYYHFHFYFHLRKEMIDGKLHRYVSEITYFDNIGKSYPVYVKRKGKNVYYKLPKSALELLDIENANEMFIKTFKEVKHE